MHGFYTYTPCSFSLFHVFTVDRYCIGACFYEFSIIMSSVLSERVLSTINIALYQVCNWRIFYKLIDIHNMVDWYLLDTCFFKKVVYRGKERWETYLKFGRVKKE